MIFRDRLDAAQQIAKKLSPYRDKNALILAIPRGAVPMGKLIADALHGVLDIVLTHKLGHPLNPEFAIGAIDEEGHTYIEDETSCPEAEKIHQLQVLKKRRKLYTPIRPRISPKDRLVIIVDDGIATGWTVKAAILAIRRAHPLKIIVATAVSAQESLEEIKKLADEVVCLYAPRHFQAVSEFFQEFTQITDDDVVKILSRHQQGS